MIRQIPTGNPAGSCCCFNGAMARRSVAAQLVRSRILVLALAGIVAGLVLQSVIQWPDVHSFTEWLRLVIAPEFSTALIVAALVAVWIDVGGREHEQRQTFEQLRLAIRAEAPALRDSVLNAPDSSVDALAAYTPEMLDTLGQRVLQARFPGRAAAADAYPDIRDELAASSEDWRDVSVTVDLTPWAGGPVSGPGSMFTATIRWEYKTVPTLPVLRFACVSDPKEYDALSRDPTTASVWRFGASSQLDAASRDVFDLVAVSVDDQACLIQRAQRAGSQTYTAELPASSPGREVTVTYTYQALVPRLGHHVFLTVPRHAYGFRARLNFGGAGIWDVMPLDFTTGKVVPRVEVSPAVVPTMSADIAVDEWVRPGFGVAFVWNLADETRPPPAAQTAP